MDLRERVAVSLPLESLWDENGPLAARPSRMLTEADIRDLLRTAPSLRFVVADCGKRLRWIAGAERFDFWKREVAPHLYRSDRPHREDYPGEYFYIAREWRTEEGAPIVTLEMAH